MIGLIQGNAVEIPLGDKSVHCVVTSPPYWGLRKYSGGQAQVWGGDPDCAHGWDKKERIMQTGGVSDKQQFNQGVDGSGWITQDSTCTNCGAWYGELGLEPTPELFVENMVAVFREVRRVLRADGSVWLNLGDSYNGSGGAGGDYNEGGLKEGQPRYPGRDVGSLKPKDLCGIPWRVAFALQADGWWLRDAIPWVKAWMKTDDVPMWDMPVDNVLDGSAMPGSQQDRPTTSYEMIFLLTKSKKYYFDPDAIKAESGAMFRNVWRMNPRSYSGAHFATFTPQLPKYAIQFGTSERGVCPECGKPWERVVEKSTRFEGGSGKAGTKAEDIKGKWGDKRYGKNILLGPVVDVQTLGWQPTCDCCEICHGSLVDTENMTADVYKECDNCKPVPATVFDPFCGSATTLQVARQLGRNGVGLDLSLEYLHLARQRLSLDALDNWTEGVATSDNGKDGTHKNMKAREQPHSFHKARVKDNMDDLPMFEGLA